MQIITAETRSVPSRMGAVIAILVTLALVVVATVLASGQLGHLSTAGSGVAVHETITRSAGGELAAQGASERSDTTLTSGSAISLDGSSPWVDDQDVLGPMRPR